MIISRKQSLCRNRSWPSLAVQLEYSTRAGSLACLYCRVSRCDSSGAFDGEGCRCVWPFAAFCVYRNKEICVICLQYYVCISVQYLKIYECGFHLGKYLRTPKLLFFFIIVVYSSHVLGSHDIHAMSALILVYELSSHLDAIPAYLTC